MNTKLSVIIPVYNVEEYVEECIKSVLKQSIDSMEIIIVDDGSMDNSINIVERFNDKRIKIIRKKNGGLSSARNTGIEAAKGKYLFFLDSDDFIIYEKAFEEMYNIAIKDKSDIVVGNSIRYTSKDSQEILRRDPDLFVRTCMNTEEFLIKFRKSHTMYSAVWMNMYKTELLKNNKLRFREGVLHEDEDFTPKIFLKSKKVSIYPKNFYAYRIREGSIMSKNQNKRNNDLIKICLNLQNTLNEIKNLELKRIMSEYEVCLILNASYKSRIKKLPKGTKKFVLKNTYNIKLKFHAVIYSISSNLYYKFLDRKII